MSSTKSTAVPATDETTITLDEPIKRGDTEITTVTVRKPKAGALRGTSLTDLMQMDVIAVQVVLPRITNPTLTNNELAQMEVADLVQLAMAVAGFLLPKSAKTDMSLEL